MLLVRHRPWRLGNGACPWPFQDTARQQVCYARTVPSPRPSSRGRGRWRKSQCMAARSIVRVSPEKPGAGSAPGRGARAPAGHETGQDEHRGPAERCQGGQTAPGENDGMGKDPVLPHPVGDPASHKQCRNRGRRVADAVQGYEPHLSFSTPGHSFPGSMDGACRVRPSPAVGKAENIGSKAGRVKARCAAWRLLYSLHR